MVKINRDREALLTQDYLKSVLNYDKGSGNFYWIKALSNKVKIGDKAGVCDSFGYTIISINCNKYRAHRLAFLFMEGVFPSHYIDHIDNNRSNNSFCNLRKADLFGNAQNAVISKNNTSGFKGVSLNKKSGRYVAYITSNGKLKTLGYYTTPEEAAKAYQDAADKYHGEFANHG